MCNETLRLNMKPCNDHENGGLKSIDIFSKIVTLQCSWIRRLYNENFHPWKVIPLYLIEMHFGKNFKFHPKPLPQKLLK